MTNIRCRLASASLMATFLAIAHVAAAQPFAYIVGPRSGPGNRGIQVLTVIDPSTRAKVAAIPLGEGCLCVFENAAVSKDGSRIFVSNYWNNTVSVVDTSTNSVTKTLNVQPFPASLAVSPDGTRLYVNTVLSPNPGYVVQVLDIASGATLATIPLNVPQSGSGMAIAPDGSRLYVTNQALTGSNIKVVDTTSNTVIATIPLGAVPRGIDITPDGLFAYVAVQEAHAVYVVSTATNSVVATVSAGTRPTNVRVTPNGLRAYAASENLITVVGTQTNTAIGSIPAFLPRVIDFTPDSATGVVAADGRVYIVNTATNSIVATIPFTTASEGNPNFVVIPQAVPPAPDPPTDLVATSIVGNLVTLRWRLPVTGSAPTGHVLEGGVSPGQVLGSIATGSASPTFTFTAPTGAFYIRLHATGPGGRSPSSNEIRIFVNTTTAPSAPADLLGLVNGSSLALAWRNTFAAGTPTSLVLEITGATTLALPLDLTDTFSFSAVPPGTYTFAVRASNAAGILSPPSNAVKLTFPGACSGLPQSPTNFVAYRQGRTIYVLWDPPTAGPAPTGYVLHVSGAFKGSFPTAGRALSGTVGAGTYGLSVAATNACGASTATPQEVITVP